MDVPGPFEDPAEPDPVTYLTAPPTPALGDECTQTIRLTTLCRTITSVDGAGFGCEAETGLGDTARPTSGDRKLAIPAAQAMTLTVLFEVRRLRGA